MTRISLPQKIALAGVACIAMLTATMSYVMAAEVDYRPLFRKAKLSDENFCYQAWKDPKRWHDGDARKQMGLDHCWDFMSVDGKRWVGLPPWNELKQAEGLSHYQLWHVNAYFPFPDYDAVYMVAREARTGRVGKKNLGKSIELNTKAAKKGHNKAQYILGLHYAEGHGTQQNWSEALRWLNRAAEEGDTDAKTYLGYLYEVGKGVTQDLDKSKRLYQEAARADNPFAIASIDRLEKSKTQVVQQSPVPSAPAASSGSSSTSTDTSQAEVAFWNAIASSDDPDELRAYLEIYPNGTYAGLARLRIEKLGGTASASTSSIPNIRYGNYHALVIGNNKYDALPDLRTAVSDARAIANLLEVDYGFNVTKLENATRYETLIAIRDLRSEIGKEDNVLIYYAGHGYLDADSGEGYWLPSDADDTRVDWILTSGVVSNVKAMQAKHVMIVADSCFSGTLTRGLRIEQRTPDYFQKIVGLKARTAMTSGGLEPVMDGGGGRYSVFANAFISVLNSNKTVLDGQQLFTDLRRKVMNNSDQTPEYGNIHKAGHDGGDFLFVRQ